MEHIDVQNKAGKKFKPGDLVYVNRIPSVNRIGLICKLMGTIENSENELQEVYKVLIGKDMKFYNEYWLKPIDTDLIKDYAKMRKN